MNKSKKNVGKYKRVKNKKSKSKNKTKNGGIRIYKLDGKIIGDPNILHEGKDFFRKMTNDKNELEICKLLMKNPHKNIIKIYDVTKNYIDMELLNTYINRIDISEIKKVMAEVKTYLQNLGVIYIDWKLDNIGISPDGQYKLFDFDVSGLINKETNEWILEPPKYWSYNEATKNGMKTPIDIDNYAFGIGFQ